MCVCVCVCACVCVCVCACVCLSSSIGIGELINQAPPPPPCVRGDWEDCESSKGPTPGRGVSLSLSLSSVCLCSLSLSRPFFCFWTITLRQSHPRSADNPFGNKIRSAQARLAVKSPSRVRRNSNSQLTNLNPDSADQLPSARTCTYKPPPRQCRQC